MLAQGRVKWAITQKPLFQTCKGYCGRQEEPAILISKFLLRMCRMYVASIRLDRY